MSPDKPAQDPADHLGRAPGGQDHGGGQPGHHHGPVGPARAAGRHRHAAARGCTRRLGIPSSVEGDLLGHPRQGTGQAATCAAHRIPNLSVLALRRLPAQSGRAAARRALPQHGARSWPSEFDRVIFDSPPLGVVTDASILARITDATMLVAKAGRTSKYALARARRQLGAGRQPARLHPERPQPVASSGSTATTRTTTPLRLLRRRRGRRRGSPGRASLTSPGPTR